MLSTVIFLLLVALVVGPAWTLWTLWREWPQRRFTFAGQIVTRDRYPVSYWMGLGLGSCIAMVVGAQGVRFFAASIARLIAN